MAPSQLLRTPLLRSLLLAAGLIGCNGSVDSSADLDASKSPIDADGQVARDGASADGGVVGADGSTFSDGSIVGDQDAQLGDSQVVDPADAAAGSDTGVVVQPSGEPVFVAFGAGFWTATSCDRGRTWQLSEVSNERGQETRWSAFGRMTFGNGIFVGATGWSGSGHVRSSASGLSFTNALDLSANASGVGFVGNEFVLISGDRVRRSSDGRSWDMGSFWNVLPGTNQMRYFRSFPEAGVAIASIETQGGNPDRAPGLWTVYSTDGLRSWKEASGTFSSCASGIQQSGDIVAVGSTLLMGAGNAALCRSTDAGRSWQPAGSVPAPPLRDLWSDGQSFYALASKTVYRLEGSAWVPHGTVDMADVPAAGATSHGTTVIAAGTKFFWTDNLGSWQSGSTTVLSGTPLASPDVRDLAVGHYAKACP